jgi:hypothetical protein
MLPFLSPPASVPGIDVRILAAVAFTGAAAYYDMFNRKWVPDRLLWAFLACAFLLNILFPDSVLFMQGCAAAAIIAAISYALYRMGQLGAADVLVMSSIALAIPYLPKPLLAPAQNVPYPFFLSVLAPTGIAFILHMLCRFVPYIARQLAEGKVEFTAQKVAGPAIVLLSLAIFAFIAASFPFPLPPLYFAVVGFLGIALVFFSLFMPEIKASMVETVPVGKLQCEDVLALEKMQPLAKRLSLPPVISERTIAALKRAKAKTVPVYTGMPFFLPYLFMGLLFSVLFGDLLFYIAGGF